MLTHPVRIYYSRDLDPADLMRGEDGEPVWPVRGTGQTAEFKKYCQSLGVALVACDAMVSADAPESGLGLVIATRDTEREGRLFAHLIGAAIRVTDTAQDLLQEVSHDGVRSIVLRPSDVSSSLLDALYGNRRDLSAPGLIIGDPGAELRDQVIRRAVASKAQNRPGICELAPAECDASAALAEGGFVSLSQAASDEVRGVLSRGLNTVLLSTHSDGVDAYLGGEHTLCALGQSDFLTEGRHYCQQTGHCTRRNADVEKVINGKQLFAPEQIAAGKLVLSVCYTAFSADQHLPFRDTLIWRILRDSNVAAVAGARGVLGANNALHAPLLDTIQRGGTFGEGIAALNRSQLLKNAGTYYVLYGDSFARFHPEDAEWICDEIKAAKPPVDEASQTARGNLHFLSTYLRLALIEAADAAETCCLDALDLCLDASLLTETGQSLETDDVGPALRDAVLGFVRHRGVVVSSDWWKMVRNAAPEGTGTCGSCGQNTQITRNTFWNTTLSDRLVTSCRNCGIVADQTDGRHFGFCRNGDVFELDVNIDGHDWMAALRIGCTNESLSKMIPWPSDENGHPMRHFAPEMQMPPGRLRYTLVLMRGADLGLASVL